MEHTKFGMYRGPIRVPQSASGQIEVLNCTSSTSTSTNGVGVCAAEITFNPNTCTEWASFAARFREYRVLGVRLEYKPYSVVNHSTLVLGPIAVATNKGAALGTPTSFNQVLAMARSEVWHLMKEHSYEIRPDDYTDLDVGSTASPSSEFSFVFYGNGFSNSVTAGLISVYWLIQFSNPQ